MMTTTCRFAKIPATTAATKLTMTRMTLHVDDGVDDFVDGFVGGYCGDDYAVDGCDHQYDNDNYQNAVALSHTDEGDDWLVVENTNIHIGCCSHCTSYCLCLCGIAWHVWNCSPCCLQLPSLSFSGPVLLFLYFTSTSYACYSSFLSHSSQASVAFLLRHHARSSPFLRLLDFAANQAMSLAHPHAAGVLF